MANTIDTNIYNQMLKTDVQENIRQKALANSIANIHSANKDEIIKSPYTSNAVVGTGTGFVNEVAINDYTFTVETITVSEFIFTSEKTEVIKNEFTDVDIEGVRRKERILDLASQFDAKVIRDAHTLTVAAGNNLGTAVTNQATAIGFAEDAGTFFEGYDVPAEEKVILVNQNTMKFFKQAGAARVTTLGDGVFFKGNIYELNGFYLLATRRTDSQPTPQVILEDGVALAVAGKPFDVYKTDLMFADRQADASAGNVSLEDVEVRMIYVEVAL
jgi:hypothetical protein